MQVALDTTTAKSNADFTRQHFGIADMSIVMNLLSRLYSHPIRTLTQEYISNGRDANREVKSGKRIEITVPTRFEPTLKIRDFGPGLSPERIKSVFLLYGASTKRDTNSQTGGFGIGAKSAWAYTDSFTITSWHGGVKRTYVVHKSAGNGNMDQIGEEPSVEPTGTMIEIASRPQDTNTFRDAVLRAVHYWNDIEKPVLKGITAGEVPGKAEELKINDHFYLTKTIHGFIGSSNDTIVLIDGIPYPLPHTLTHGHYSDISGKLNYVRMVIRINNADVNVSPNREEIITDAKSEVFFKSIFAKAWKDINAHIEGELAKAKEVKDCLAACKSLMHWFRIQNKYKEYSVSNQGIDISVDHNSKNEHDKMPVFRYSTNYRKRMSVRDARHIAAHEVDDVYYIDVDEFKSRTSMRVRNQVEVSNKSVILINKECPYAARLIKDLQAKPVSSLALPAIQRSAKLPVEKRQFCIHVVTGNGSGAPKQVNLADITDTRVYIPMSHRYYNARAELAEINNYCKDINFCFVADSNLHYVQSKDGKQYFVHIDDFIKDYQAGDAEINASVYQEVDNLNKLKVYSSVKNLIKDPILTKAINMVDTFKADRYKELPKVFMENPVNKSKIDGIKKFCTEVSNLIKNKYPLLNSIDTYRLGTDVANELVEYMNAKYSKGSV